MHTKSNEKKHTQSLHIDGWLETENDEQDNDICVHLLGKAINSTTKAWKRDKKLARVYNFN